MRILHILVLAALLFAIAVVYVSCGGSNVAGPGAGLFPGSLQYSQPAAVK